MAKKNYIDPTGLAYAFSKIKAHVTANFAKKDLSNVDTTAMSNLGAQKTHTALSDLGLSGAKTMAEVCAAMTVPSRLTLSNNTSAANHISDVPGEYGTIEILRVAENYCTATWAKSNGNDPDFYHGIYHSSNGWSGWFMVYSEHNKPTLTGLGALPAVDYYNVAGNTIPSGADLNTYTTPGTYRCASGTISQSLVNTPHTTGGFKMTVKYLHDSNQLMQTIEAANGSYTYVRAASYVNSAWTFRDWSGSSTNIQTYSGFDQIDLDDASFAGQDLLTIMRSVNTAVGTSAVELFIHTTPTINPNFRQAILNKLAAEVEPFETTWTANITAYMRRSKSLYQSFIIDVVYQNDAYQNSILSAVYNANSDGTDSMSTFVYSKLQDGFLPLAGGTLTGKNLYFYNGIARVLGDTNRLQFETSNVAGDTTNRRVLHLRNSTHTESGIADALALYDTVNGTQTIYKLYGDHNKAGTAKGILNRSTPVNQADTNYGTYMARGIALSATEVTPSVNGAVALIYQE